MNKQLNIATFNLSIKEKNKAKQNGFVLLVKTDAGKSTLLNAII